MVSRPSTSVTCDQGACAREGSLTLIIADRYEVKRPLAQGGMGAVYVAVQHPLGREVALKVIKGGGLDETAVRRFEREAKHLASLRHRHIVTVYDFGESDDGPFLAMELLTGPTLRQRLTRQGALGERRVLELVRDAASGLAAAHEAGITHRDLKPSNILFAEEGRDEVLKLLDFGLATQQVKDHSLTESSAIVGTPGYIAPERALHGNDSDPRGDLYALGVIAFEALTGVSPYQASTAVALVMAHATEPVPTVRERRPELVVSPGTEQLILELMAKQPEQRPVSATDVARRCTALLAHIGSGAPAVEGLNPSMVTERSSLDPDSQRSTTEHAHKPSVEAENTRTT